MKRRQEPGTQKASHSKGRGYSELGSGGEDLLGDLVLSGDL